MVLYIYLTQVCSHMSFISAITRFTCISLFLTFCYYSIFNISKGITKGRNSLCLHNCNIYNKVEPILWALIIDFSVNPNYVCVWQWLSSCSCMVLYSPRLLCHDLPDRNTGVGCHILYMRILLN